MLLFIGGAARTGKGILARRLLVEQQVAYLSLDVLKMGLTRGVPEYHIDPDAGALHVAERLWPLVREMSYNLIAEQNPYVIEGEILPRHVAALQQANPAHVRACFLGYPTISVRSCTTCGPMLGTLTIGRRAILIQNYCRSSAARSRLASIYAQNAPSMTSRSLICRPSLAQPWIRWFCLGNQLFVLRAQL